MSIHSIRTHGLSKISRLPLPLDQGSRPNSLVLSSLKFNISYPYSRPLVFSQRRGHEDERRDQPRRASRQPRTISSRKPEDPQKTSGYRSRVQRKAVVRQQRDQQDLLARGPDRKVSEQ